jgi:hypothetical protein
VSLYCKITSSIAKSVSLYCNPLTALLQSRSRSTAIPETTLMETIDLELPLDPSGLGKNDMAYRFFYATNGYLGWIMHLIRHARHLAIKERVFVNDIGGQFLIRIGAIPILVGTNDNQIWGPFDSQKRGHRFCDNEKGNHQFQWGDMH